MQAWLLWALAAVVLLIAEALTGTLFLIALAAAAVAPAVAAALGAGLVAQLAVFGAAALLSLLKARPLFGALLHPASQQVATNVAALPGAVGLVLEPVRDAHRAGRVTVGGDDWRAVTADGSALDAGEQVVVLDVQGVTLTVARYPQQEI
ncbi:MAG TPA: NfeD family protein [Longimicrobium sp.]